MHAASALSGATGVRAVEFDTHFQRHTSGNQTATAGVNTPVASTPVPLAATAVVYAVMCTCYNVSQLKKVTNKTLFDINLSITSKIESQTRTSS